MNDGLKVIVMTGSYYGYGVTKVGWIRRVSGDEWEILPGAVIVIRTGERGTLEDLAAEGLGKRYKVHGKPSKVAEHVHRLGPRRIIQANEGAWKGEVPRPDGWKAE